MKKILFIDRDGTLIKESPPTYQIDDFSYRGFSYTPLYTTGVAVLMGGDLPPAYQTNVFFVRLKLGL